MPFSRSRAAVLGIAVATLAVLAPGVAHADPPGNDDFDSPTVISTLPFTAEQDTSPTRAVDDPRLDCSNSPVVGSVWFTYTATEDGLLRFSAARGGNNLAAGAYTGERGDLRPAGLDYCAGFVTSAATVRITAGTTYHLMVNDDRRLGSALKLTVDRVTAPANDDFADAKVVASLPFTGEPADFGAASAQPDEPFGSCSSEGAASVWYRYTPARNEFLLTETESAYVTVYEGTTFEDLRARSCAPFPGYGGRVVELTAGRTYHLQLTGSSITGARLKLSEAPELRTFVSYTNYGDQSVYDTATRFEVSHAYDFDSPVTSEWDFGDGTTLPATGVKEQQHRYTAEGSYTVTVRSRSADGRTSSGTQTIVVKTRDVGITSFSTPSGTIPGRPGTLTVGLANHRYADSPRVEFYKSVDNDWKYIGERTVQMAADSTAEVSLPYRFTTEDAAVGKVAFRAAVYLPSPARDSRPDNEVVSIPTFVLLTNPGPAHDATITGFTTPANAAPGEQKPITVQVRNDAFAERAVVSLHRLDGGFGTLIGEQTVDLPASGTIDVPFAHTFTAEDARIGKVAFRASVRLTSSSDSRFAGNVVTAVATTVGRPATAAVLN
ncbi:PKD domain-containing protein [Lentzea sp. NPDC102401]|uniref:PKD domain-containing protein n=1 Tax=Lentzea sp. NPDC102401 TaxID=3364128 RepID=UPI0038140904